MIGTPVTATLWLVWWKHRAAEPDKEDVAGHTHLVTADPSGRDLFELLERHVLGPNARPEQQFTVMKVERGCEVAGTALTKSPARWEH